MVERKVDVIERVGNRVSNRRRQPTHHSTFLRLVKLALELASAPELRCHFIEGRSECPHLIPTVRRHSKIEIASRDLLCGNRKLFYWSREPPDKKTGNQSRNEQQN